MDFSCDGKWAVYVTYTDGTLWRSKLDGSDRLQLTYPPLRATVPHWSPDGNLLPALVQTACPRTSVVTRFSQPGIIKDGHSRIIIMLRETILPTEAGYIFAGCF